MYCIIKRHGLRGPWRIVGGRLFDTVGAANDVVERDKRYDITATEYKVQQLVDVVQCP